MRQKLFAVLLLVVCLVAAGATDWIPASPTNIKFSVRLLPTGRMIGDSSIYRISFHYSSGGMTPEPDISRIMDLATAKIAINGQEFYLADLTFLLRDEYMGRKRDEPFIVLGADDTVRMSFINLNIPAVSAQLAIPEPIDRVVFSPDFRTDIPNTQHSYRLSWNELEVSTYQVFVTNPRGGDGIFAEYGDLTIGPEYLVKNGKAQEKLGFEVDAVNQFQVQLDGCSFYFEISSPKPFVVQNFNEDEIN
ncbi:MAG: hypothetical protein KKI09_06665 [Spirochaetes bacterium]|nr:hypothetical protein [Spirochaetota bacterium]